MSPLTYICADCNRQFHHTAEDEERARSELLANFGAIELSDCAKVCDDCYRKFFG